MKFGLMDHLRYLKTLIRKITNSNDLSINDKKFLDLFFENRAEKKNYYAEFDDSIAGLQSERIKEFYEMVPENQATFGGMNKNQAKCLYAIIRSKEPKIVVETGVCNGVSTLVILLAIKKNQRGTLYSVDYPTFSDDPAPKFQEKQYPDDHTFSAIPKGKSPGWIIPKKLRDRWNLRIGKSQRKLPPLLNELEEIDLFIHDSDHTIPCMIFEYEIAWEFLKSDGVLLSDDIHTNNAFATFGKERANQFGEACSGLGFACKN